MTLDTLRNDELAVLANALNDQRTRSVDVVVPGKAATFADGNLVLTGMDPIITDSGVSDANGMYSPTGVALEGVSSKLDIPIRYLRRMRSEVPALFDANVNEWLSRSNDSYLFRLLAGQGGDACDGIVRAMLSDRYRTIDNFDVLVAALGGIQESGLQNPVISADLTERKMIVRVAAPEIAAYAPDLLRGYRSPFGGQDVGNGWTPERVGRAAQMERAAMGEGDDPIVFAGFVLTNSEVGAGAFSITPRLIVKVCQNGLTITADAMKAIHLGARLDSGVVRWSDTTIRKNLELVTSQTKDAVGTFLDVEYVRGKVAEMEQKAGAPVKKVEDTIAVVSKRLGFTEDQADSILSHFIMGGQLSAMGVANAITSVAQTVADGDAAYDMEAKALASLDIVASLV